MPRRKKKATSNLLWIAFLLMIGVPFVFLVSSSMILAVQYADIIQEFEESLTRLKRNTVIYDRFNQPYTVIDSIEDRQIVPGSRISHQFKLAVLAIEDARYFRHRGVDLIRIFGAMMANLKAGGYVQGGSTITQQLVKLLLLSPEKTITRKLREVMRAVVLELHYSKQRLLNIYLNTIYLGNGNYGVERAARSYFNLSAGELSLSQSAFLAGLIHRPESYLNLPEDLDRSRNQPIPQHALHKALERRNLVLFKMLNLGWIDHAQYQQALQEVVQPWLTAKRVSKSPWFVKEVFALLKNRHHLDQVTTGGYKIYTTIHPELQQKAEAIIHQHFSRRRSYNQAALLALEPEHGEVLAMVGGRDFTASEFNRATQAYRQPGSAFKTILYATALEQGYRINASFVDEPQTFSWTDDIGMLQTYEPQNYDRMYGVEREQVNHKGEVYYEDKYTLAKAFYHSLNTVAVQLLHELGIEPVVRTASRLGIRIEGDVGLCLALGCKEVTLEQLVSAYLSFVNQGRPQPSVVIRRIVDNHNRTLYEHQPRQGEQVFHDWTVHQMRQLLSMVVKKGTGTRANWRGNPHDIGGKTGTNSDYRDAWFIGLSPEVVAGIWVGNDDNRPMKQVTGGRAPARLWRQFMQYALATLPDRPLPPEPAYKVFPTCSVSGGLAMRSCPHVDYYHYPLNDPPAYTCDLHPGPPLVPLPVVPHQEFTEQLNQSFEEGGVIWQEEALFEDEDNEESETSNLPPENVEDSPHSTTWDEEDLFEP